MLNFSLQLIFSVLIILALYGCGGSGGGGGGSTTTTPPTTFASDLTIQSAAIVTIGGVAQTNPTILPGTHSVVIHTSYPVSTLGWHLTGAGKLTFSQDSNMDVVITFTATDNAPCFLALWQVAG